MKLQSMVGYKLFKELDDGSVEVLRITNVRSYKDGGNPSTITVRDEGTGETNKVRVDSLKDYKPLEPDGLLTFNIVSLTDQDGETLKDVVVTASKFLNLKIRDTLPFAVCRQNITDIFYNLLIDDENKMMAGLSINQSNCPTNFDFCIMLSANNILYFNHVNFYRTDTLKDILSMVKINKFDEVLENLYKRHAKASKNPNILFKKSDKGWCKDLETLLSENNFQTDINEMLGITDIDFDISKYIQKKQLPGKDDETYDSLTDDLLNWLSSVFKVNINDATIIEFDHDINLGEFNNSRYFLLRDNTYKLYMVVYTCSGEYLESDLENESEKKDFSSEFRINFYNKYKHNNDK